MKVLSEHLGSIVFCIHPVQELLGACGRIAVVVQNSYVVEL